MKKITCWLLIFPLCVMTGFSQEKPHRFFGVHFDFHATADDQEIGKYFDGAVLEDFLRKVQPDFIQIDSKGHPGYSSYPTEVGYSTEHFFGDPLRQWRDVTARLDIPLYVHYSSIWDDKAVGENPSWGRINADGSIDRTKASIVSDYTAKIMIQQIKEMISRYDIDGIWIDGDCWSTGLDYSPSVVSGFLRSSGLKEVPKTHSEPGYMKWLDYNRKLYKDYLRDYVDEIHRFKPTFHVASNWAYSSMMPEFVDVDIDFLSGDVSGRNSIYSAAFQARCLSLQGKPWDLMAWGFVPLDFSGGIHSPKSAVQLKQEAAQVLSMGGGFQVYFQQNRDASFQTTIDMDAMVDLAAFCRERQPFCFGSSVVPQIAVWYSLEGWKRRSPSVYGWSSHMEGMNNLLLDGRHTVEITMDHHLRDNLEAYPLIVIPEWDAFDETLKKRLLKHVENGASLLVVGAQAVRQFEPLLGVRFDGDDRNDQFNIGDETLGGVTGIRTRWQPATANTGTTVIGHVYRQRDYRFATPYVAGTITNYGKGKIAAVYFDISEAYNGSRHSIYNRLVDGLIEDIFPDAKLQVSGPGKIHATLARKDEDLLVNLINVDGGHFNEKITGYSYIAPTGPLTVTVETGAKPTRVVLQPDNEDIEYVYDQQHGRVTLQVPPIDVHRIVQLKMLSANR